MRVAVLGGGVIGVATAWHLLADGHEVVVVDRHEEAGCETSFANAGFIATGHCAAWASPQAPLVLLRSLFREDAALRLRLRADPALWRWGLRFLANCTAARFRANTRAKLRLCLYSREQLVALRRETGLAYADSAHGALYLHRDPARLAVADRAAAVLREEGLAIEAVDAARCIEIEPALAPARERIAGAMYCPTDESGDCLLFTRRLMELCLARGAEFRGGAQIAALREEGGRIVAAATGRGDVHADAFVLALGSYSPFVARTAGDRLPVYPAKGYSLTAPGAAEGAAPRVPVLDEDRLIAYSTLGNRFRVTATAEFAGYDTGWTERDFRTMVAAARELFPGAADCERPEHWACLRPMTPDGPPIIGRRRHANLWYNTGHGHVGWTMACGSARIVADLIAGRRPAISLDGMDARRF